jgi:hypothetical protein
MKRLANRDTLVDIPAIEACDWRAARGGAHGLVTYNVLFFILESRRVE